jgi:hypothetical protein
MIYDAETCEIAAILQGFEAGSDDYDFDSNTSP